MCRRQTSQEEKRKNQKSRSKGRSMDNDDAFLSHRQKREKIRLKMGKITVKDSTRPKLENTNFFFNICYFQIKSLIIGRVFGYFSTFLQLFFALFINGTLFLLMTLGPSFLFTHLFRQINKQPLDKKCVKDPSKMAERVVFCLAIFSVPPVSKQEYEVFLTKV